MKTRRVTGRNFSGLILALGLHAVAPGGASADQQLTLQSGWNLISIGVQPADPAVTSVFAPLVSSGKFQALWAYDSVSKSWNSYPATPGTTGLENVETGKGYWLKVTSSAVLTIGAAEDALPPGAGELQAGWNLVGFPTEVPVSYVSMLRDIPVSQIWRFDPVAGFVGVNLSSNTNPPFSDVESGRGYWVFVTGVVPADFGGLLGTAMRGDSDFPPLLPDAQPGDRPVFSPFTPGDENIGEGQAVMCGDEEGDIYFDRPETQRALSFVDNTDTRTINISNEGKGVLNWHVAIVDPENKDHAWLRIRTLDPDDGHESLFTSRTGSVTTGSDAVDLLVDRTGLGPGLYTAMVAVESNGRAATCPVEPTRMIPVRMRVADIDGDYEVRAEIDTVNGIPADLPNPRLFLSIYRDGAAEDATDDGRIKAIIDESRTLLFPNRVRLAGGVYQDNTAKFTVSGSVALPVGANNPYTVPIRRDVTLIGDRRERGNPADSLLGPQDLKGEYHETIRDLLGGPIDLSGTFTALRVADKPSALDPSDKSGGAARPIEDDVPVCRPAAPVTEKMLLTEVDVSVNITHTRPSDLMVSITSPSNEKVILRSHSTSPVGEVEYDETAPPLESLDIYKGTLSKAGTNGVWTLCVEDTVNGETGTLNSWFLHLKGTKVSNISGTVSSVGAGATVVLTGCGVSRTTTTGANGVYTFENLVDCAYRVVVFKSGFQRVSQEVVLSGDDATGVNLAPASTSPDSPMPVMLPAGAAMRFASLTTAAGSGALSRGLLRYAMDSATFDIDRQPKVGSLKCGASANLICKVQDEDTSEFSGSLNQVTQTNLPNIDGTPPDETYLTDSTINGPVGVTAKHTHAYIALGGPIVGASVSGSMKLAIGALP